MQGSRLLIIDDDQAVRESLAAWFEQSGVRVSQATNATDALSLCDSDTPDLVLCDLNMPGMTGLQFLARCHRAHPDLPVIIISGKGDMSDVIQALKLGAWDYVTKPIVDIEVLEHAIRIALERADLLEQNRQHQRQLEDANHKLLDAIARMHSDELAGQQLQFQLLPENGKRLGSYIGEYRLLPSGALSGDFVDYFVINARHIGFYLTDVAGHGISSALVTVMLKNTMSRLLQDCWQGDSPLLLSPAETLSYLNRQFCANTISKHLTLFYGVIDQQQHRLRYACAGHYPATVLIENQQPRFIGYKSPPLGLFDDADYPTEELALARDAQLLLTSDGILEQLPAPGLEAKEQLLLQCLATPDLSLEGLLQRVGLDGDTRHHPDDISLLLISRRDRA